MDWNGSDLLLFRYIVKGGFPFPAAGVMSPEVGRLDSAILGSDWVP
jgi:hypothetical protein